MDHTGLNTGVKETRAKIWAELRLLRAVGEHKFEV
jgi:hypothetical protein